VRRGELIANLLFATPILVGLPIVLAIQLFTVAGPLGSACLLFYLGGAVLLATAKTTLFRRGIWISWGTSQMSRSGRQIYLAAYSLILLGFLLNTLVLR
jgi:hypothetical protein